MLKRARVSPLALVAVCGLMLAGSALMPAIVSAQTFSGPITVKPIRQPVPDRTAARTELLVNNAGLQQTGEGSQFWFEVEVALWRGLDSAEKPIEINYRLRGDEMTKQFETRPVRFERITDKPIRATAFLLLDGDNRQVQRMPLTIEGDLGRAHRFAFPAIPPNKRLLPGLYKIKVELVLSVQRNVMAEIWEEKEEHDQQNNRYFKRIDPRAQRPASATVIVGIAGRTNNRYDWMALGAVHDRASLLESIDDLPALEGQIDALRRERQDNVTRQALEILEGRRRELMEFRSRRASLENDVTRLKPLEDGINARLSEYDTKLRDAYTKLMLQLWQMYTDAFYMTNLCMPGWRIREGSTGPDPTNPKETMTYSLDALRQKYDMARFINGPRNQPAAVGSWNMDAWKQWVEDIYLPTAYQMWVEFRKLNGDPDAAPDSPNVFGLQPVGSANDTMLMAQYFNNEVANYNESFFVPRFNDNYLRLKDAILRLPNMIKGLGNSLAKAHQPDGTMYPFGMRGNPRVPDPDPGRAEREWQAVVTNYEQVKKDLGIDPLADASARPPIAGRDTRQFFQCPNCKYTAPRPGKCPLCKEYDMQKTDSPFGAAGVEEGSGNR